MKYAIARESVVESIQYDLTEEQIQAFGVTCAVVECTAISNVAIGWLYQEGKLVNPNGSVIQIRHITNLALMNRLSQSEYDNILSYIDDHTKPYHYDVQQLFEKLKAATYIDLNRNDTILGVHFIANLGIITQARCLEILNNPVLDSEIPQ